MTQIITTSSTTPGINITAAADEFIYVDEGVTRVSTGNIGLFSNLGGARIHVLGSLVGASDGMNLSDGADATGNFQVTIGATGSIIGSFGLALDDDNNTVTNQGQITGYSGSGIHTVGDDFQLTNTGTITSHGSRAVYSTGAGSDVVNYGLIQSLSTLSTDHGIDFSNSVAGGAVTLTNFGTISAAGGTAVRGDSDGVDRITNFGAINGNVKQDGGSDYFRNGGQVVGNVDLGADNDLFRGGGGTVDGNIHGRAGNDTIIGGISDDAIFGDSGEDVLKGGSGDDTLTGGNGHDIMRGDAGSDTFDFNRAVESVAGSDRDHINDFSKGEDVIDVSGIDANTGVGGNQSFSFVGSAAFSGTAGELRAINSGPNAVVAGDNDGDTVADFLILVAGVHGLTVGDFIL